MSVFETRSTSGRAGGHNSPARPDMATRKRLRSVGLRCTPQRAAIYQALREASHPTAEELHAVVSRHTPTSLATVYNTLDAFTLAGLILRIPSRSGCCRYCGEQHAHLHLRIAGSEELMDVPMDLGDQIMASMPRTILSEIEQRMGIQIKSIDVQLSGSRTRLPDQTDSSE